MTKLLPSHQGYNVGHPWYYFLGGAIPTPKQIRADAEISGYKGYREADIEAAHVKPEPKRSASLRMIREDVKMRLSRDISRYREVVRDLRAYRSGDTDRNHMGCAEVHMSMSLKYAHIYNGFAHLHMLDNLPNQQIDLFGF